MNNLDQRQKIWIDESTILNAKRFCNFDPLVTSLAKHACDYDDRGRTVTEILLAFVENINKCITEGLGLYLWSNTPWSGKTSCMRWLAIKVLNLSSEWFNPIIYCDTIDNIKNKIKQEFDYKDKEFKKSFIERMKRVTILMIDDLGSTELQNDWHHSILKEIIDDRYNNKKILIITSNRGINNITKDSRINDRIKWMCKVVHFPELSSRQFGI